MWLLVMRLILIVPPLPIAFLLLWTKPGEINIWVAMRLAAPPPIILGLVITPLVVVVVISVVVTRSPMNAADPRHRTNQSSRQTSQAKSSETFFHVVVPVYQTLRW